MTNRIDSPLLRIFTKYMILIGIVIAAHTIVISKGWAQGSVVPLGSPAYRLLERADNLGLLQTPFPQLRPLSRKTIALYLFQLDSVKMSLSVSDRNRLHELLREFTFEHSGTLLSNSDTRVNWVRSKAFKWLPNWIYRNGDDLSQYREDDFTLRINPKFRYDVGQSPIESWNGLRRMGFGWSIQADWQQKLGINFRYIDHFDAANSSSFNHTFHDWQTISSSDLLVSGESPSSITRNPGDSAKPKTSDEYIVSETSLSYQVGRLHILLGREPISWGPGVCQQLTLGRQTAPMDQIRLDFELSRHFRFMYIHGWLYAQPQVVDSIYDPNDAHPRKLDRPKYVAAHRVEWTPNKRVTIGISESVIYGDRAPDLPYLIPINLFFASEENRGDNDNKSLTVDFKFRPIDRVTTYGGVWVDDLTFGKVGTGFLQNKFGYLAGAVTDDPFRLSGTRWLCEYTRMDPYAGGHFYAINRYDHWGRPLGLDLPPDADRLTLRSEYTPTARWQLAIESQTARHIDFAYIDSILVYPGSILRMYPYSVQERSLSWGSGAGSFQQVISLTARYEFLEHFWVSFAWQQNRTGTFISQSEFRKDFPKGYNSQARPGLFDWASKKFDNTSTLWTLSVMVNPDR